MSDTRREGIRRRSLRLRTPDTPALASEIKFGLPTPTTQSFEFQGHWSDSDDEGGTSSLLFGTASQGGPVGLGPTWRNPLDEELVRAADGAKKEVWHQPIREPFSASTQQESLSNFNSASGTSIPEPMRRSQRLAISAKQRTSEKDLLAHQTPRRSLRIALNKPKATATGRLDLTAVEKASQRANAISTPARKLKKGQPGLKKSPVIRRDFHKSLSRQGVPKEGSRTRTSQTKEVEAVSPGSAQTAPASEDIALRPALAVLSGPTFQSDCPPELGTRLEPWEVAPGRLQDDKDSELAFSTTSLTGPQETRIGPNLGFHVLVLKPGNSHRWPAISNRTRLCSIAAGKLSVEMAGRNFAVGPRGLLKIGGGVECTVQNKLYLDAILHVCAMADE